MSKKIYLSPSNQNRNLYSYGDTNEMIQCNKIATELKKELEKYGFEVKKARQGQEMYTSISESNSWGADLHIPIHTNAFNGKVTGGTLVMLYNDKTENVKAGKAILNALAPISPGADYSLKYRPELAELNSTNAIAVYIEVEFHDTKTGAKWIIENTKNIAKHIAKGICNYYGVTQKNEKDKVEEMYRVGTEWIDGKCKNQKGAFKVYENAKNLCNKYVNHYVFDSKGNVKYKNIKTKKSNEEIAKEVIRGLWGNGATRRQKLTQAGYNYSAVQSIVNKMLRG